MSGEARTRGLGLRPGRQSQEQRQIVRVGLLVTEEMGDRLRDACKAKNLSASEVVRRALDAYLPKPAAEDQGVVRRARVELGSKSAPGVLDELDVVRQYLPTNYSARLETHASPPYILIEGQDDHCWTLDGYVIPRLGSGLIVAKEVT